MNCDDKKEGRCATAFDACLAVRIALFKYVFYMYFLPVCNVSRMMCRYLK
jgi:hypothetical protein